MFTRIHPLKYTFFTSLFSLFFIINSWMNGLGVSGNSTTIIGVRGAFPAPLYQRWFSKYNKQKPNVRVIYQPIGSGSGVKQFTEGTIDFGGSDVAIKDDEIIKVKQGVILLPMTAGSFLIAYKLANIKSTWKLSRSVIANIFVGKIQKWNDPAIAKTNPGINLPDSPITVIRRSEGKGHRFGYLVKYEKIEAIFNNPQEQATKDYVKVHLG